MCDKAVDLTIDIIATICISLLATIMMVIKSVKKMILAKKTVKSQRLNTVETTKKEEEK